MSRQRSANLWPEERFGFRHSQLMRTLLVAACLCLFSATPKAFGDFVIEQQVQFTTDKVVKEYEFTWHIGESDFRVEARKGTDPRWFVFNGRVFYVCGKMGKAEMDFLAKLAGKDQATALARFEKGICQELPADFAIRFILSPYEAIGNIDMTGGYGTNLRVATIENTLKGSVAEVATQKCVDFARRYKITDATQPAYERSVTETTCNGSALKWRGSLNRQTGMALVRSPGGQPTFQALNSDVKTLAGFPLSASAEIVGKDAAGIAFQASYQVATKSVVSKDLKSDEKGMPSGFELLDTRTMTAVGAPAAGSSPSGSAPEGNTASQLVKFFILGGNPAAVAATGILKSNQEKEKKK